MSKIDEYPGIKRWALVIAYDNGMINRTRSEEAWLENLFETLMLLPEEATSLDAWLQTLGEADMETLGAGEYEDLLAIQDKYPGDVDIEQVSQAIFYHD